MTSVPTDSAAPTLPRGVQHDRARAGHLSVAMGARQQRRARLAMWAMGVLMAVGLFVLVAFHVLAVQQSFSLDRLTDEQHGEELRYERLRSEVATLSAPGTIVQAARERGMQPATSIDWIDAPAAAPSGSPGEQTSSTLADIHERAKASLGR
jgi:hypothetical protein